MARNNGFTLLELMLALFIVAVLVIVAAPSLVNFLRTTYLQNAAQQLYYTLQYARTEAVKRNVNIYVSFQTGSNWCYGVNISASCNCAVANNCALTTVGAPTSSSIALTTTGVTNGSIIFDPSHGAPNASATLTYTLNSVAMSVKVGLIGSLQICSSQVGGYQACT